MQQEREPELLPQRFQGWDLGQSSRDRDRTNSPGTRRCIMVKNSDQHKMDHKPLFIINFGQFLACKLQPATNLHKLLRQFMEVHGFLVKAAKTLETTELWGQATPAAQQFKGSFYGSARCSPNSWPMEAGCPCSSTVSGMFQFISELTGFVAYPQTMNWITFLWFFPFLEKNKARARAREELLSQNAALFSMCAKMGSITL